MKKKLLIVLFMISVLVAVLAISISANTLKVTQDDIESIVVTDGNPRADKVWFLFDGVLTVTNVSNDGPYNEWYGKVGDEVIITFKEELMISTLALYITGNWCEVDVYGISADGIQVIYGTSIGENNLDHVDGEYKPVFEEPEENAKPVKKVKLVVKSYKWSSPRTLKVSEVYALKVHEHEFITPGNIIKAPTCSKEGAQTYYCSCGEPGSVPVPPTGEHDIGERIVYRNGYHTEGILARACSTCSTQDAKISTVPALFTSVGYSVSRTGKNGVTHGVKVNQDAIKEYNKYAETPIQYGMVAASRGAFSSGNPLRLTISGIAKSNSAVLFKSFTTDSCALISYGIMGFADIHKDTQLIISAYIYDGSSIYYLSENRHSTNVQTISYNEVINATTVEAIINKED
ncbi:MAG: hypothetical protein J6B29_04670 [Clostridia bacterium]|nr:hypothetical protein [Clostridia bacterium]